MANNNTVRFAYGSQSWYDNTKTKDPNCIYFINNTKKIYRGEELFSDLHQITYTNDIDKIVLTYEDTRIPGKPVTYDAYEPGAIFIETKEVDGEKIVTIYSLNSDNTFDKVLTTDSSMSLTDKEVESLKELAKYTVIDSTYIAKNGWGLDPHKHLPDLSAIGYCLTWISDVGIAEVEPDEDDW